MTSALRATAILGTSSLVTVFTGLLSTKVFAVLIGPSGLGFMGLLQSLVGVSGLIAGLGVGVGIIRLGAGAAERGEEGRIAALGRAGWLLTWSAGVIGAVLLIVFRAAVSRAFLAGEEHAWTVALMAPTVLLNAAAVLQTSLLNAHQRIVPLARLGVATSVAGPIAAVLSVWLLGIPGIAVAILANAIVAWTVSRLFLTSELPVVRYDRVLFRDTLDAAKELVVFGVPYTLSMLVGSGVQLMVPVILLQLLDQSAVGYYRAAATVATVYLGFLLTAMSKDYLPRIASPASSSGTELGTVVNDQHRLLLLVGGPMVLGMLAFAPLIVPIVFTSDFLPTVAILNWYLIGEVLRFSSWTAAFVILARMGSTVFFLTELSAGTARLVATVLAVRAFGLPGVGLAHLITFVVYQVIVWGVIKKRFNVALDRSNALLLVTVLAAASLVHLLPRGAVGVDTVVVMAAAAAAFTVFSVVSFAKARRAEQ